MPLFWMLGRFKIERRYELFNCFCAILFRIQVDTNLFHLTASYLNKELKPNSSLSTFIQNKHSTESEIKYLLESKARKNSENWTRAIAITGILVNISLVLFQKCSTTKPQEIKIMNAKEIINDTINSLKTK
jgi:hypothetical protein